MTLTRVSERLTRVSEETKGTEFTTKERRERRRNEGRIADQCVTRTWQNLRSPLHKSTESADSACGSLFATMDGMLIDPFHTNRITSTIIGCAIRVHRATGPGLELRTRALLDSEALVFAFQCALERRPSRRRARHVRPSLAEIVVLSKCRRLLFWLSSSFVLRSLRSFVVNFVLSVPSVTLSGILNPHGEARQEKSLSLRR